MLNDECTFTFQTRDPHEDHISDNLFQLKDLEDLEDSGSLKSLKRLFLKEFN